MDNPSDSLQSSSEATEDTKVCPYCAETIKRAAIVCRYCGRDLAPVPSTPPVSDTKSPPKKKGFWSTPVGVIAFVLAALILLYLFYALMYNLNRIASSSTSMATTIPTPTTAQIKEMAITLSYDDLARETEKHIGKIVHYKGTALQVIGDSQNGRADLRVQITGNDVIYLHYSGPRILEGDTIDFYAKIDGRLTYEAILGNQVTVPEATAMILTIAGD